MDRPDLAVGDAIVVRTPDRREYRGSLLEIRGGVAEKPVAVVRLDTGWETTYPLAMVHPIADRERSSPDASA